MRTDMENRLMDMEWGGKESVGCMEGGAWEHTLSYVEKKKERSLVS